MGAKTAFYDVTSTPYSPAPLVDENTPYDGGAWEYDTGYHRSDRHIATISCGSGRLR